VVVDPGASAMTDAATLAARRQLGTRLLPSGGRLSIVCRQPRLAGLMQLILLRHSFGIFESLPAALRAAR
jgi:hypothetical protein